MHPTPTVRAFYRDLLEQVRLLGLRPDRGDKVPCLSGPPDYRRFDRR